MLKTKPERKSIILKAMQYQEDIQLSDTYDNKNKDFLHLNIMLRILQKPCVLMIRESAL